VQHIGHELFVLSIEITEKVKSAVSDCTVDDCLLSFVRYLYFSSYKSYGSKIIRSDMAGKNARILFQYPNVFDATGMTVDYAEDK